MNRIHKISIKLFLTYVVACLIPILLTSVYLTNNLAAFTKENTRLLSVTANEQLQKNLLDVAENVENIFKTLTSDPDLTNYLTMQHESDYEALNGFTKFLNRRISSLISDKYKILIYSDNNTIGISRMTNNSIDDFYRLYGDGADTLPQSSIHACIINSNQRSQPTICFYKVFTISKEKPIIYTIEIPATVLIPYSSPTEADASKICLFDAKGTILASSRKDDVFSSFSFLAFDDVSSMKDLSKLDVTTLDGVKYCVFFNNLANGIISNRSFTPEWYLLFLVPYSNLQENLDSMTTNSLLIIFVCIALSLLLATVLAKDITRRIIFLSKKTKDVLNGEFEIMQPVKSQDELGSLESDMYEMVIYLKNMLIGMSTANKLLMEEQLISQRLKQEKITAELLALRRQINPHFLFNTLESIRMNLVLKDDMDTANIIWMFSKSYRTLFETEQHNYKLNDELILVNNYIQVQKYRLGDKFDYHVDMDTALGDLTIPKLVLQPLVENALYHGVEGKCKKSDVTVTISTSNEKLEIVVLDNGAGIEKTRLEDIKKALSDKTYMADEFLALRNIQTRVELISRGNCSLSIESQQGIGTAASLTLPLVWEHDSNCE